MITIKTDTSLIVGPSGQRLNGRLEIQPVAEFEYALPGGHTRKVAALSLNYTIHAGQLMKNTGTAIAPNWVADWPVLVPNKAGSGNCDRDRVTYRAKFTIIDALGAKVDDWVEFWVLDAAESAYEITAIPLASVEELPPYIVHGGLPAGAAQSKDVVVKRPGASVGFGTVSIENGTAKFSVAQSFPADGTAWILLYDQSEPPVPIPNAFYRLENVIGETSDEFAIAGAELAPETVTASDFRWVDGNQNLIVPTTDMVPLKVRGANGQSMRLFEIQDAEFAEIFAVSHDAQVTIGNATAGKLGIGRAAEEALEVVGNAIVTGGLAIGQSLTIEGNTELGDDAADTTVVTGSFSVNGVATAGFAATVHGGVDVSEDLRVGGVATLESSLTVDGTIGATGDITGFNLSGTNTGDQTISLVGDAIGIGNGEIEVALVASGAVPGTYGNETSIPVISVDAKGRVTSISTAPIEETSSQYKDGVETVAALRAVSAPAHMHVRLCIEAGTLFYFHAQADNTDDDGVTAVRPTEIAAEAAGRWLRMGTTVSPFPLVDDFEDESWEGLPASESFEGESWGTL